MGIFQWWYGAGLAKHARHVYAGILRTADFFSIGLLIRTLFNPFRQISAGAVQGGLPEQFRAWADRTFSRVFGAFLRSFLIIIGMVCLSIRVIYAAINMVAWLVLPAAPFIGVWFWALGVGA